MWLNVEAKKHWRFMVKELRSMRLLARIDLALLAGFCQSWARWEQAEAIIETHGLTMSIETKSGGTYEQQRPEVAIAQKSLAQMQALGRELGWSAAARGSLKVAPVVEKPKTLKDRLRGNNRSA
jgi:P27 family predicted phage terminase small subunit